MRRLETRWVVLASICAMLAFASRPSDAQAATQKADPLVLQVVDLINRYRKDHGLDPLAHADDLSILATEHSNEMAGMSQLSHTGFQARFRRSRSNVCVENVAFGFATAERLLQGWQASSTHHQNLLEPKVARMGVAATGRYVTFFACR